VADRVEPYPYDKKHFIRGRCWLRQASALQVQIWTLPAIWIGSSPIPTTRNILCVVGVSWGSPQPYCSIIRWLAAGCG